MTVQCKALQPHDVQAAKSHQEFALDVLLGLSRSPKALPSKYFYDAEGNRLFQKIMELPEYYLTECEFEIFQNHKDRIGELIGSGRFNLVELGAGDGQKTRVLIDHFLERGLDFRYIPIDICEEALKELLQELQEYSPPLHIEGLVSEYFVGLKWLSNQIHDKNVVLFLGSNIGNFSHSEARVFLYSLWNALNDEDYVLIGFDLKKDIHRLTVAYNDSQGITAAFNLNLLRRINRELGGNFDLDQFRYYSAYNVYSGAVESFLISLREQTVYVETLNQSFSFEAWEPVHTEYSHKYLVSDIVELAEETGYEIIEQSYDSKRYFVDSLWQVRKNKEM
jgi:L-histidine N-alpha-methyltransferase